MSNSKGSGSSRRGKGDENKSPLHTEEKAKQRKKQHARGAQKSANDEIETCRENLLGSVDM